VIGSDVVLRKHVFHYHNGCHRVRPAGMNARWVMLSEIYACFTPTVERKFQVIRQCDRQIAPEQRGERDEAAIAPRKIGTLLHITEQAILRVFVESNATI
jgi:hypothetical protein